MYVAFSIIHGTNFGPTGGFMNFELGPKQQEIKERAAEFADREVAPHAAEWDREARFPAEVFGKLVEAGFVGLRVPGGMRGRDSLSELCRPLSRVTGRTSPPPRVYARCRRRLRGCGSLAAPPVASRGRRSRLSLCP